MGLFKKIIAGGLGWTLGGPIGAIIGIAIASMFDGRNSIDTQSSNREYTTHHTYRQQNCGVNDFQIALLVLMASVVKADGRVVKEELSVVKRFLVQNYGEESAREAWQILNQLLKQNINVAEMFR
jgi:DnaJ like chaperone protein